MDKFTVGAVLAVLLFTTPAFAETMALPNDSGTMTMTANGSHQTEMSTTGKITEIDLAKGTLTLDTGFQFTLAPSFEYTSFPALGQEVQVTYHEQGGQNVAWIIDVGGTHSQGQGGSN